jgi:hypothetical protein
MLSPKMREGYFPSVPGLVIAIMRLMAALLRNQPPFLSSLAVEVIW